MEIASYVVGVSFNFPKAESDKLDAILKSTESKLSAFTISKFKVDKSILKTVMGTALDIASKQVVFEVSRFAVNERALKAAMLRAGRVIGTGGSGSGGSPFPVLSQHDWMQRQQEKNSEWTSRRRIMNYEALARREESALQREHSREMQEDRKSVV